MGNIARNIQKKREVETEIALMSAEAERAKLRGYVCVPIEPTEEMISAGVACMGSWKNIPGSQLTVNREKMRRRYKAMIEAAMRGTALTQDKRA